MRWLMPLSFALVAVTCFTVRPAMGEETEPGAENPPAAGEKPGRPPGRPPLTPEMKAKHLAEFDVDGDGVLSDEEKAAMKETLAKRRAERAEKAKPEKGRKRPTKEEIIAQFDENGDGKLTGTESEKARAAYRARNQGEPKAGAENTTPPEGMGRVRNQDGGPGGLNDEMKARMVREFDANGDGQLQGAEMERARGAFGRLQAQQRQGGRLLGPGGGGGGAPGGGGRPRGGAGGGGGGTGGGGPPRR